MTTSNPYRRHGPSRAYVWIWLPGESDPVVCGVLDVAERSDEELIFSYGQSYLARRNAIPVYLPELPLESGGQQPANRRIASCIEDAGPDSWGKRVILNRRIGGSDRDEADLTPLTYFLESSSERIGALDFQESATEYVPRATADASLEELAEATERLETGKPLAPALREALVHGTALGGARPKASLRDGSRQLIAKFSMSSDLGPIVQAEFVAMELARRAGLDVPKVEIRDAARRQALLVERFDRPDDGTRLGVVTAATVRGLGHRPSRMGSYYEFGAALRERSRGGVASVHELFGRITFNILVGNDDDHVRNHSTFWDGSTIELTPAYDITPQVPYRPGMQMLEIGIDGWRASNVAGCVERASTYLLSGSEAHEIVDGQIEVIRRDWDEVCDLAGLTGRERDQLNGREFLHPGVLEGY